MKEKSVVVFGAGRFGSALAEELFKKGLEVMVVDKNKSKIQDISTKVTLALIADVHDEDAIAELGLPNFDIGVVAIGDRIESSVIATVSAKEAGIKTVYAKAKNDLHAKILRKIGADHVVFPEKEIGYRLALSIAHSNIKDYIQFGDDYSISESPIPEKWVGKSLEDLDIRKKHNINIIAIKSPEETRVNPHGDYVFKEEDYIIIVGKLEDLEKLDRLI